MTFLTGLAAQMLQWILVGVASLVTALIVRQMRRAKIKKAAQASVEPLKKAKTAKEIDEAANDALDDF
jgi:hypothetical protein